MNSKDESMSETLYVRPVVEEFKAFVQHKIDVLERFKNVEELKVYLDALELGDRTIRELQAEEAEQAELTEVEFKPAPEPEESPAVDEEEMEEDVGMETEDLDTAEDGEAAEKKAEEEWALPDDRDVLIGEREEEKAREREDATVETVEAATGSAEEEEEEEGDTHDAGGEKAKGLLTRHWKAPAGKEAEDDADEEAEVEVEQEVEEMETPDEEAAPEEEEG